MNPVVRILSHASADHVVYDGRPLLIHVAAHSDQPYTVQASALFQGAEVVSRTLLPEVQDYSSRVPVECYQLAIPADRYHAGGSLAIVAYAGGSGGESTDTTTIRVFQPYDLTQDVGSTVDLRGALVAAVGHSGSHIRIRFVASATYVFPSKSDPLYSQFDLSSADGKLVTFEPASGVEAQIQADSPPLVKRAIWKGLAFTGSATHGTTLTVTGIHTFISCRFSNTQATGRTLGLWAEQGARVKLTNCFFDALSSGCHGVEVIRGAFWRQLSGIVFSNTLRVLEGTTGYGLAASGSWPCLWARWDVGASPFVRYNIAVDLSAPVLSVQGAGWSSAAVVGNVWNTAAASGVSVQGKLAACYWAHNSVRTDPVLGASFTAQSDGIVGGVYVNNYFTRLDPTHRSVASGNLWDFNATESANGSGPKSLSSVVPGFSSKYLVVSASSSLLRAGSPQPGVSKAFGFLPYQNQIGAMPYVSDANLVKQMQQVLRLIDYGVTTHDSLEGDFTAPNPGSGLGGQLSFVDGTQSGWLAVV